MDLKPGMYVLATKYDDGDPGDAWAVGYYIKQDLDGRHLVGHKDSQKSFRPSGYRRCKGPLKQEVGDWLMKHSNVLETSPAGTVNLWSMLTDNAFQESSPHT